MDPEAVLDIFHLDEQFEEHEVSPSTLELESRPQPFKCTLDPEPHNPNT